MHSVPVVCECVRKSIRDSLHRPGQLLPVEQFLDPSNLQSKCFWAQTKDGKNILGTIRATLVMAKMAFCRNSQKPSQPCRQKESGSPRRVGHHPIETQMIWQIPATFEPPATQLPRLISWWDARKYPRLIFSFHQDDQFARTSRQLIWKCEWFGKDKETSGAWAPEGSTSQRDGGYWSSAHSSLDVFPTSSAFTLNSCNTWIKPLMILLWNSSTLVCLKNHLMGESMDIWEDLRSFGFSIAMFFWFILHNLRHNGKTTADWHTGSQHSTLEPMNLHTSCDHLEGGSWVRI